MSPNHSDTDLLAAAAKAAYDGPEEIASWAAGRGFKALVFNEQSTDTQGFVARDEQRILLAFRGTAGRNDWLLDARVARENHVHAGFADAVEKSWNSKIAPLLVDPGARQILITGHSLGGALALLAARRIGTAVSKLVTFGQPRAVDEVAAGECQRVFGDRYLRVIHDKDVVPRVPGFTGGYRHCGAAVRIGGHQNTAFPCRVETAEDAVRLVTGRDIAVPSAFEAVLPLLEKRVDHFAAKASGGVEVIEQIGDLLGTLLPSPLTQFVDRFDETLNKTARAKSPGGLSAPEIFEDHKMLNYLAALGR